MRRAASRFVADDAGREQHDDDANNIAQRQRNEIPNIERFGVPNTLFRFHRSVISEDGEKETLRDRSLGESTHRFRRSVDSGTSDALEPTALGRASAVGSDGALGPIAMAER
jgi:hypothetical protein